MSYCRAVFEINLSDPESLVLEIYRQCASSKFLQAACSAFGSQAGFLDQHTCTVSPSVEVRVSCWLKIDQMLECIWKPVLLLRHAKATSSCLCRQTLLVSIVPVSSVGGEGCACYWCKVSWKDSGRICVVPSALLSCGSTTTVYRAISGDAVGCIFQQNKFKSDSNFLMAVGFERF